MKKSLLLLICLVCFGLTSAYAQAVQLSGTVISSEDNMPLPGVSVLVKGATSGALTDADGKFIIKSNKVAKTLVFSCMGYKTQEVEVGTTKDFKITMEPDAFLVDEVVFVAYGVQSKRDVSGSIASVKGEALKNVPVQSFDQALQGKAAGVNVTIPNGVIGNAPVIRVRGYNSISGSSSPLVVVDGIPLLENVSTGDRNLRTVRTAASTNMMGDINPGDIASIEILKDASATAVYGSRAANGVILITTKKGVDGASKLSYDGSVQFTQASNTFDVMDAYQYIEHKNRARANIGLAPAYFLNNDANGNVINTDWRDYIYQTGFQHNHNLSFSGANKTTNYYVSLGYTKGDGMVKSNDLEKRSARFNIEHKINKMFTVGSNVTYSWSLINAPNTGSLNGDSFSSAGLGRTVFITSPIVGPYKNDGSYNIDPASGMIGTLNNTQSVGFFNPVFLIDKNKFSAQSERLLSSIYLNVNLLKDLYFRTSLGLDNSLVESKQFWHPEHGDGRQNGGLAANYIDRRNRWNITNTLNYTKTFLEKLKVTAMAGSEEQYTHIRSWSASQVGLTDIFYDSYEGGWTTPQQPPRAALEENYFLSFFGRLNIDWNKKYFVEVSGRRDGYSGLASGNKFGNFGGMSFMWNASKEEFLNNDFFKRYFSDLRIKASYGRVGNISAVSNYASLFLYGSGIYNGNSSLYFAQAGNADLRWEASNKFDFGVSFGLLKDKIQVDFNYFNNTVEDLIIQVPQSPSKGIPDDLIFQNIGSMKNNGIELTLTSYNIDGKDFKWNTTLNLSTLHNEVTALAPGVPSIVGVTSGTETTNRTLVGYPIGNIWGVKTLGVDPQTGRRVFEKLDGRKVYYDHSQTVPANRWKYEDGTNAAAINITDDGRVLGSPIPKVYGGLDNNFNYKNFDLSIGLSYAFDFKIYNGSKAGLRDQRFWNNSVEVYETAWKNPGDITDIPKPIWGDNVSNGSTMVQSQNVEKGDFVKLRNLSFGYNLSEKIAKKIGVSKLRLYFQAFNLYTFTKYTGADPEISSNGDANITPGVDRNSVPQARTYSFGINLTF